MKTKNRVIVSVINDLNTDQRVHKVCTFIENQGYNVLLVGRKLKNSLPMEKRSYQTYRFSMFFQKGPLFYAWFNIRLFFFLLVRKSTILVSNDLDTLLPNYLVSQLFKRKLIYDSHEYFTEVPELISRPKVKAVWEGIEKRIFPKLENISTVNQSIADRYKEKYGKTLVVVRNVSPLYHSDSMATKKELGIPENKHLLIMQGAGLNIDRGVEEAIRMMPFMKDTALIIVGDGDIIPDMKNLVHDQNWQNLVYFYGKRPYRELMKFTKQADLGLSFDQPTNPNYLYSLPNKIFDYIHTHTPIVCSNVVEVVKIVNQYSLGIVIDNFEPQHLAQVIQQALTNSEQMKQWKENCVIAAEKENWENESQKLITFYPQVHG